MLHGLSVAERVMIMNPGTLLFETHLCLHALLLLIRKLESTVIAVVLLSWFYLTHQSAIAIN